MNHISLGRTRAAARRSRDMAPRRRMSPSVDLNTGIPTRATTRDHPVRHHRARAADAMSSPSLRDACTAHAREALAHGAHESAARWASLALSRRDVDDEGEGAAVASGRTSDGWRRDAIDLEIKGDAPAARGDARAAAAYRRAPRWRRESAAERGRASASGRDAMDGDETSGDEMMMKLVRTLMKIGTRRRCERRRNVWNDAAGESNAGE